jgi:hypothetical protein
MGSCPLHVECELGLSIELSLPGGEEVAMT